MRIEWKDSSWDERTRILLLAGERTPYFIRRNRRGDYGYPSRYTLWGAGMGDLTSAGYRIAGFLGGFKRVSEAKAHALALCQQPV